MADTALLLGRLAAGASLGDVSREIAHGSLLRKRSASGRRHIVAAVRRRFIENSSPLPGIAPLSVALHRFTMPVARSQVLLPYLFTSDVTVLAVCTGLVLPRLQSAGRLAKADVVAALQAVFASRHQRPWGGALQTRWAEGLLSVLREIGALGRGAKREQLLAYSVRPEVFSFHLWGLYEHGVRGAALHETPFWQMLLLQAPESRRLVGVVADRAWWKFTSPGGVDQIVPVHGSLMEWLDVALG